MSEPKYREGDRVFVQSHVARGTQIQARTGTVVMGLVERATGSEGMLDRFVKVNLDGLGHVLAREVYVELVEETNWPEGWKFLPDIGKAGMISIRGGGEGDLAFGFFVSVKCFREIMSEKGRYVERNLDRLLEMGGGE